MEYRRLMQIFLPAMILFLLSGFSYANVIQVSDNKAVRTPVLLWVVVKQQDTQDFITDGSQDAFASKIDVFANGYGLPVVFPLLDLPERLFITEQDAINLNVQPLLQAAERYNTNIILVGNLKNIDNIWQGEWRLMDGIQDTAWNNTGHDLDGVLEAMVSDLANKIFVKKVAVKQSPPKSIVKSQDITVLVKDINSVSDYANVLAYLKTLDIAQQVAIGSVDGNQAMFIITAKVGREDLIKALNISNVLIAEPVLPGKHSSESFDLIYRKNL